MIMCGAGPFHGAIADAAPGLSGETPATSGWDRPSRPATHSREVTQTCRRRVMASASAALLDGFVDNRDGHLDPLIRQVVLAPRRIDDLIRHVHAPDHLAEHRVLAVQKGRVLHHDEELRTGAVRVVGSCHGDDPSGMGLGVELRLELLARAAHPVLALFVGVLRVGVPALNHEPRDDAVKERLVVEARLRQRDEVFDMLGAKSGKNLISISPNLVLMIACGSIFPPAAGFLSSAPNTCVAIPATSNDNIRTPRWHHMAFPS